MKDEFDILIDLFLESRQLGHYNTKDRMICLYDIRREEIAGIKKNIDKYVESYRLLILSPLADVTNINIELI